MNENLSDKEIVLRIVDGEIRYFDEIFKRYKTSLCRYVQYLSNNSDIVDDVIQNVFLKVYCNINQYNPKYSFNGWIYRITHNETLMVIYKEKKHNHVDIEDPCLKIECLNKSPYELMCDYSLKKEIEQYLGLIRKDYAEILVHFYIENKTYKEISTEMNLPLGSVGTYLLKAKQELLKFKI